MADTAEEASKIEVAQRQSGVDRGYADSRCTAGQFPSEEVDPDGKRGICAPDRPNRTAVHGADSRRLVVHGGRRLVGSGHRVGGQELCSQAHGGSAPGPGMSVPPQRPGHPGREHHGRGAASTWARAWSSPSGSMTHRHHRRPVATRRPTSWSQPCGPPSRSWGPLVARFGQARVAMPGGCNIGPRQASTSTCAVLAAWARVVRSTTALSRCPRTGLRGDRHALDYPSVGATENLLMAAAAAAGTTVIENAAREPEIVDLASSSQSWEPRSRAPAPAPSRINGGRTLHGTDHTVVGDRIEAGTYLAAGVACGGEVEVHGISPQRAGAVPLQAARHGRAGGRGHPERSRWRVTSRSYAGRRIDACHSPGFQPTCRRR